MRPVPKMDGNGGCIPRVEIVSVQWQNIHVLATAPLDVIPYRQENYWISLDVDIPVEGDVLIRVSHYENIFSMSAWNYMFRFAFHTNFITNHFLDLNRSELDGAGAGAVSDNRISSDMGVRVLFADPALD